MMARMRIRLPAVAAMMLLATQPAIFSLAAHAAPQEESDSDVCQRGCTVPRLLEKVDPEYTDEAKAARIKDTVVVSAEVWPDGKLHNIRVHENPGYGLEQRAIEALEQWCFQPGEKDGKPAKVRADIELHFQPY